MKKILVGLVTSLLITFSIIPISAEDLGYEGKSREGDRIDVILEKLKNDPENSVRTVDDWTIIETKSPIAIWSFAPKSHPAFPAYAKRQVVEKDGSLHIQTSVTCGADKAVCDDFVRSFIELNQKIKEHFEQQNSKPDSD